MGREPILWTMKPYKFQFLLRFLDVFGRSRKEGNLPAEGFEPPTYGLQNRCTTTVLSRHGTSPRHFTVGRPRPGNRMRACARRQAP